MKIQIETIPHSQQRYRTCGDWYYEDGVLHIKVSEEVGDWHEQSLIAVHELVEVLICQHKGISQNQIDEFDKNYESERKRGLHSTGDEPGDDSKAPYYKEHQIATGVEKILAAEIGVDWNTYANKIEELP